MILEGIVTTRNRDDSANISPMGPDVREGFEQFLLRPFQTSVTYQNLKREEQGVLHVTDDVELIAQAAVRQITPTPDLLKADSVDGWILADCCRWYAFEVTSVEDKEARTTIRCRVVDSGKRREFFGFNRAKHAVVEAAILATRIEFLPAAQILEEFKRLEVIVQKTSGPQEKRAFAFLEEYVEARLGTL